MGVEVTGVARFDLGHHPQQKALPLDFWIGETVARHCQFAGECPSGVLGARPPDRIVVSQQAGGDGSVVTSRSRQLECLGGHRLSGRAVLDEDMRTGLAACSQDLRPSATSAEPLRSASTASSRRATSERSSLAAGSPSRWSPKSARAAGLGDSVV